MFRYIILILILVVAVLAEAAGENTERLQQGAATLQPFKEQLRAALLDGLAHGPVEAIEVCRLQAPKLAKKAGSKSVRVGRTSHMLRNPDNAPHDWMKPLLAAYLADPADRTPRISDLGNGRWGYVEPIYTQSMCLICHGESISTPVQRVISTFYPEDRAVGFRDGQFRGLFWVEFDPAE